MINLRDPSVLRSIRPQEVSNYLRSRGWVMAGPFGQNASIWVPKVELDETIELLVPHDNTLRDYALRLAEILDLLEAVEERPKAAILDDLLTASVDVVRIALDTGWEGTVNVEHGVQALSSARDLLTAAACAAVRPKPRFHARRPSQVVEYLSNAKFGQTDIGSYVITIHSEVPPFLGSPKLLPELEEEPFERKVMKVLAQALNHAVSAAQKAAVTSDFAAFEEAVTSGVSANLCEALVGLGGEEQRKVAFDFSWATTRPLHEPVPRSVVVSPGVFPTLREAARIFRTVTPAEDFLLRGPVTRLERQDGAPTGTITVWALIDDRPRQVLVDLSDPQYSIAIEAHANGIPISCVGDLARDGRSWRLHRASHFQLDPDVE